MAKGQIISMDFIMAFIIFMSALSIFFSSYQSNIKSASFNVDPKLVFSKLAYMENSFLEGAKLKNLDGYLTSYDMAKLHNALKDISAANYCIYLHDGTQTIRNFAAYENTNNIYFGETECGENKYTAYSINPVCKGKEAVIVTKPVVYNRIVMSLNVLICAK